MTEEKYTKLVETLTDMVVKLRVESLNDLKNGDKKVYDSKQYIANQIDMMIKAQCS